MADPQEHAGRTIHAILCAAVVASPLDPGLEQDEVVSVALKHGVGLGAARAALASHHGYLQDRNRRLLGREYMWGALQFTDCAVPPDIRPGLALDALDVAFDELENELGPRAPLSLPTLRARCAERPESEVNLALGLLIAWELVEWKDAAVVRAKRWPSYAEPPSEFETAAASVAALQKVLADVRDVFARRGAGQGIGETPTERFERFLRQQGWIAFATWWAMTSTEMRSMLDTRQPSAICTLCGALLEGALVAIAHPAMAAGEWNQRFLSEPPETWKLGKLVDQAETAKTFTKPQAALALELGDMRNRIHAGRFSTAGSPPFTPPRTEAHQARQCRDHLDRLLEVILAWPPIRALT